MTAATAVCSDTPDLMGALAEAQRVAEAAPQHMSALNRANQVRLARAELKREVAAGNKAVAEVVAEVPWETESMTISDLLMAQHRWGRTRTRRFLASVPMAETKTIGSMTDRQRSAVVSLLRGEVAVDPFDRYRQAAALAA